MKITDLPQDGYWHISCQSQSSSNDCKENDLSLQEILDQVIRPYRSHRAFYVEGVPFHRSALAYFVILHSTKPANHYEHSEEDWFIPPSIFDKKFQDSSVKNFTFLAEEPVLDDIEYREVVRIPRDKDHKNNSVNINLEQNQ